MGFGAITARKVTAVDGALAGERSTPERFNPFALKIRPAPVVVEVREVIEQSEVPARIIDLHVWRVWRVGRGQYAVAADVVTKAEVDGNYFREDLVVHEELVYATIEVARVLSLGAAMQMLGYGPAARLHLTA